MNDYRQTAALALAKCAAYDPWFPKASEAIVVAWAEQIEYWKLDLPDVLDGVIKMYADNGSGFKPLPKDLIDAARAVRADRCQRETPAEREAREDAWDQKLLEANQRRLARELRGFGKSVPELEAGEAESA